MMDQEKRYQLITQLSKVKGDGVLPLIAKEIRKISGILEKDTSYEKLSSSIDILNILAVRHPSVALLIYEKSLARLSSLSIPYNADSGLSQEDYEKYHNRDHLMVKLLEGLSTLSYLETEKVYDLLMHFCSDSSESVRSQAISGIKGMVSYKIPVIDAIGYLPQQVVLDKLTSLDDSEKKKHFNLITMVCYEIFSPTQEDNEGDYKSFTFIQSEVPVTDDLVQLRKDSITLLKDMYSVEGLSIEEKKQIISTMHMVEQAHHAGHTPEFMDMSLDDTKDFLKFLLDICQSGTEDYQVLQKIEHDVFWVKHHRGESDSSGEILDLSQRIRGVLLDNPEYAIFRILIGFESVFEEEFPDETGSSESSKYDKEDKWRKQKAYELADGINNSNFDEWASRIGEYSRIKSDDMATFPTFGEFLKHLGTVSPDIARKILEENQFNVDEKFFTPLMLGILGSGSSELFENIASNFVSEGKHLSAIAFTMLNDETGQAKNIELARDILQKVLEIEDTYTLCLLIYISARYISSEDRSWMEDIFIPAMTKLTELNVHGWVYDFWWRKECNKNLVDSLTDTDASLIIDNFRHIEKIDYRVEAVLAKIASKFPELVLNFFGERLNGIECGHSFDAVPYQLREVAQELSKHPALCVDTVYSWIDRPRGLHRYDGPRLLKVLFLDFPKEFEDELLKLVQTANATALEFVTNVLLNYDGNSKIHPLCKEIVRVAAENEDVLCAVRRAIRAIGVVCGEYGFSEALMRRAEEMEKWLDDGNEDVRKFAQEYVDELKRQGEYERKRAEDDVELRKYKYGEHLSKLREKDETPSSDTE